MTWTFAFPSNLWPSVAALCLLLFLAGYSWRRRSVPGALPFMVGCLFTILLTTGLLMANLAADPGARSFWLRFMFSWVLPSIAAVTCFILEYAWPGRWLSRRNLILFSILPLFYIYFFLGGGYVYMGPTDFATEGTVTLPLNVFGLVSIGYFLALTLINLLVFTWLFIRSPQHRWPVLLMAASQISMRFIIFGQEPTLAVKVINLPSFTIPYLAYAIALFGFRIFDPIPLARQTAIDQMQAGLVVLDLQDRVVSLNPAAARILGLSGSRVRKQRIRDLLPTCPEDLPGIADGSEVEIGLAAPASQDAAGGKRYITLTVSRINDFRGQQVGRLLMIQDVTGRKQAEATLNESKEIQRLIFENASEGIAIYEEHPERKSRRLVECNERYVELSGRSKAELLEIGDTMAVQRPLPPVPYARPRNEIRDAQSEGFFTWVRPDGKENTIEYRSETIWVGERLLSIGLDRDVTERMRAQAQILEQQSALATQAERERMARELHDSLGQVLGYASFQVGAAAQLARGGQGDTAAAQLDRLGEAVRAAHADLREHILNLRSTAALTQPLVEIFQQYLDGYASNYEIITRLEVAPDLAGKSFTPELQLQLFRILQEALSNARKHGAARHVAIRLAQESDCLRLSIQDDGRGFDPQQVSSSREPHYGLQFMRERAEQLKGSLQVLSAPGSGTRVLLEIPYKE
jgi:PAS domain S-box-containing protein